MYLVLCSNYNQITDNTAIVPGLASKLLYNKDKGALSYRRNFQTRQDKIMAPPGLDIFYHEMSQPSRSVLMFVKLNNIKFNGKIVDFFEGETRTPEYLTMNPKHAIPTIKDGEFVVTESSAGVIYLASKHNTPDHWYPADLQKRARVHELLEWRTAIRKPGIGIMVKVVLGKHIGVKAPTPEEADAIYKELDDALGMLDWYLKDQKFLCGDQITIADLFIANEVFQPSNGDRDIYVTHPKIKEWMGRVRDALNPVWDEVIAIFRTKLNAIQDKK